MKKIMSLLEDLLKNPAMIIGTIRDDDESTGLGGKFVILATVGFLFFGLTLGSFSFENQLWAAPLKTMFGLFMSALICLPSLYIFTALTGAPLQLPEIVRGFGASLALMAALLLGFTPVLWVFSQSSDSEPFFGFLVLVVWLIAFFFGTGFLFKMLKNTGVEKKGPVKIWVIIFLLVTLQMSTTLRPIIGTSDHLFTMEKRFFLEHWAGEIFGVNPNLEKEIPASWDRGQRDEGQNPFLEKE